MATIRVAGVQMGIVYSDVERNLERIAEYLERTSEEGVQLTVFPECTTTGYCFDSFDEIKNLSEGIHGQSCSRIHQLCRQYDTHVVFGFLERHEDLVFNSLALMSPAGLVGTYRKIHLPLLGLDRFTQPGDKGFGCFDIGEVRVGLNICYDSAFPESSRCLALMGADLIVLPTNWPKTSNTTADHVPNTRALENHVYYMAINRIGCERGVDFIGKSKICDPLGTTLAFADHQSEAILYATIDTTLARQKHIVNVPGEHEIDRVRDRRPEFYDRITQDIG